MDTGQLVLLRRIAAKFLWKRISLATKSAMPELEAIWNVGKAMKRKDHPEIFSALKYSWSADVAPIMQKAEGNAMISVLHTRYHRAFLIIRFVFAEEIRRNTLKLLVKSYSSLEIEKFCQYIGCDEPTALSIAEQHGWRNDGKFVFPGCLLFEDMQDNRSEFNAFEKLTDSISFLEN